MLLLLLLLLLYNVNSLPTCLVVFVSGSKDRERWRVSVCVNTERKTTYGNNINQSIYR